MLLTDCTLISDVMNAIDRQHSDVRCQHQRAIHEHTQIRAIQVSLALPSMTRKSAVSPFTWIDGRPRANFSI